MVLVSFYSAIDSWFLAQYVSTNAMAAINIVLPYSNLIWGLAVMFTCGSCALVGIKLGEGKRSLANTYFTSMFWFLTGFTAIFAIVAYFNMDRIIYSLGSTALLFEDCKTYLKYMILGTPILAVKLFLEYYIRLDGRPAYSLVMSLTGFILNIVLDYYTIVVLGWGVFGASVEAVLDKVPFVPVEFSEFQEQMVLYQVQLQRSRRNAHRAFLGYRNDFL